MTNKEFLFKAVKEGNLELLRYAVKIGTNIHAENEYALRVSANRGHLEIVQYLVENGADIYIYNNEALRWATAKNHTEVVNYLKSIMEKDKQNQTDTITINISKNVKKLVINFE
jgi:ankyrin repeat protein